MRLELPDHALVVLVGAAGSGKTTFAARHFGSTEVVSSDRCRELVADDPSDQSANEAAFDVLHVIVAKRLAHARRTVVDATNVRPEWRAPLVQIARRYDAPLVAIVLDVPAAVCRERLSGRPERPVRAGVVARQVRDLRRSLAGLEREGFELVHVLDPAGADTARLVPIRESPQPRGGRSRMPEVDAPGTI
jgi:predicted kinase